MKKYTVFFLKYIDKKYINTYNEYMNNYSNERRKYGR